MQHIKVFFSFKVFIFLYFSTFKMHDLTQNKIHIFYFFVQAYGFQLSPEMLRGFTSSFICPGI